MKLGFLIIAYLGILTGGAIAQSPAVHFEAANGFYKEGAYEEAAKRYDTILKLGYESAEVYYNLGNCYFKSNQLGLAILNYKRAEQLDPFDDEIRRNLSLAQKAAIDDFEIMPLPLFRSAYLKFLLLLSADTWAILGLIGLSLLIIGSFLYLFSDLGRLGFILGSVGLIGALLFTSLAVANRNHLKKNVPAIVMSASSYAKSGPGDKAEDVFILHEGAEVKVIESYEGWRKIKLPDGKVGWILGEDIEVI